MSRLLVALPLAVVMTLATFSIMAWMVSNGTANNPPPSAALNFAMVMVEQEQQIQRRKRTVPEPPKPPEMPQQAPAAQIEAQFTQVTPIETAALQLDTSITGIEISAAQFNDLGNDVIGSQPLLPLYRIEPRYPNKALKRNIEGYVVLSFSIDPSGKPTDIQVVEANPKRIFEREAVLALRKWKYQPETVNGVAIAQPGQTVKLEFKLAK